MSEVVILKKRIKQLESEICERTRSYLLHTNNHSRNRPVPTDSAWAQTDPQQPQLVPLTANITPQHHKAQLLTQEVTVSPLPPDSTTPQRRRTFNSFPITHTSPPPREVDMPIPECEQLEQSQLDTSHAMTDRSYSQIHTTDFDKERRLRSKVKKLTAQLEFQKNISNQMREGLMRSEQENYQLRLANSALLKESQEKKADGNGEKEADERLLSELIHKIHRSEKEINRLNQVICRLEEENYAFKQQLSKGKDSTQQQNDSHEELGSPGLIRRMVDSLFTISNNIPQIEEHSAPLFRPQSQDQIIQILERVEEFSRQIQKWEQERTAAIEAQKSRFMEFIKKVTRTLDQDTRHRLLQQASKVEQIKHYVKALMASDKQLNAQRLSEVEGHLQTIEAQP